MLIRKLQNLYIRDILETVEQCLKEQPVNAYINYAVATTDYSSDGKPYIGYQSVVCDVIGVDMSHEDIWYWSIIVKYNDKPVSIQLVNVLIGVELYKANDCYNVHLTVPNFKQYIER